MFRECAKAIARVIKERRNQKISALPFYEHIFPIRTTDLHNIFNRWECFMEPGEGIGPSTSSLPWKRSTTELPRHKSRFFDTNKSDYFLSSFLSNLSSLRNLTP